MKLNLFFASSFIFLLGTFSSLPLSVVAEQTIKVKAQVGSIVAGPSSIDDSEDEEKDQKSSISPISAPVVSVEPATLQGAVFSMVGNIPQFTTPRPTFKGASNIQNASITLTFSFGEFTLRAFTEADEEGNWSYISSEDFPNGNFQLKVLAVHPLEPSIKAQSALDFHVLATQNTSPWNEQFLENSSQALFDLSARVQQQYKVVAPGENIIASIQLVNFSATGSPIDVLIEYSIQDEAGREILHLQETVAVGTKLSFLKTFYTQPDLREGVYRLIVKTPSRNILAVASSDFTIKGKSGLALTPFAKIDYTSVLIGVGAIFFTFIFLSYFEFIRFLRVKKHIRYVTSKLLKRFF